MIDPETHTRPAPMEGHGIYNRSSRVQAAGLSPAVPLLEQAARSVPLETGSKPIVIADYGSSAGHNSLGPMVAAINALRERAGPEREISIVHTDLPDNDFAALFQTLIRDPNSYLRADPKVFASAAGRSFYEQILPSQTVTLGWSSWAVQWLSQIPALIPDQIQVFYSRDPIARAAFARQAATDWRAFLTHRGRELRSGGQLVMLTMAIDENGDFGYTPILVAMYAALMEMVKEGFVHPEEARRMVIPTVGRSRADLLEPFEENGCFAGLSIEHVDVFLGEDRIWTEYQSHGDAQAFGARWAAFSRASVFPSLATGLEGGGNDPRAASFFDRLEASLAQRLAAAPQPMVIPLAKALLRRTDPK
jgi:hypothetical protein